MQNKSSNTPVRIHHPLRQQWLSCLLTWGPRASDDCDSGAASLPFAHDVVVPASNNHMHKGAAAGRARPVLCRREQIKLTVLALALLISPYDYPSLRLRITCH